MKVHEIIEASIEWVAYDGVLGTEPCSLQQYLAQSDPSIDDEYFAYIYTLLVDHPSIRVSLSKEPLAAHDKTVRLGDAPLPDDYEVPAAVRDDVNITEMYQQGVKGRALAYHLFGEEYTSSKDAIKAKREKFKEQKEKGKGKAATAAKKGKKGQGSGELDGLIRDIGDEDGMGTSKWDLAGLENRWGSRLRLRCTDDEVYFRLTGSHTRNPKITSIVLQTLQHSVKSRERGITTVELGPLVGASQGSMHHYMKTLTGLGLCAKVPTVLHASVTNLLVFHKFLERNVNYIAHTKTSEDAEPEPAPVAPELDSIDADDEKADNDTSVAAGPSTAGDWGLSFATLTEADLMSGLVVQDRVVKLLNHPGLTNHLLRAKNLLPLLGWQGDHELRHRRAVPRALRRMIVDDIVEYVEVGENKVKCLRLTKYNPDFVPRPKPVIEGESAPILHDVDQLVRQHAMPLVIAGGITPLQSIPYQMSATVIASGTAGMIQLDIHNGMFGLFRRFIEFFFVRMDKLTKPTPHLQHLELSTLLESFGKERRLRAFGRNAYYEVLRQNGEVVDETVHPPVPPEAGHFADVSYRMYYGDLNTYWTQMEELGTPSSGPSWYEAQVPAPKTSSAKRARSPSTESGSFTPKPVKPARISSGDGPLTDRPLSRPPKQVRQPKYDIPSQVRGRPRKYIHVVRPDGSIDRHVIGLIPPHPDLEAIYVYLPDLGVLVPGPTNYTGLGPPPPIPDEVLEKGVPPEHFDGYVRADGTTGSKKRKTAPKNQETAKDKGKAVARDQTENTAEVDVDEVTGPSKRPRRSTAKAVTSYADASPEEINEVAGVEDGAQHEDALESATAQSAIDPALTTETSTADPGPSTPATRTTQGGDASVGSTAAPDDTARVHSTSRPVTVNAGEPSSREQAFGQGETMHSQFAVPSAGQSDPVPSQVPAPAAVTPEGTASAPKKPPKKTADVVRGYERKATRLSGVSKLPTSQPPGVPASNDSMMQPPVARGSEVLDDRSPTTDQTVGDRARSPLVALATSSPPPQTPASPPAPFPASGKASDSAAPLFIEHETDARSDDDGVQRQDTASATQAKSAAAPQPETVEAEPLVPIRPVQEARKGKRLDLGAVRRANEMLTVLQQMGGVREEHDLWNHHREWSFRVAGTDAPNAPLKGATMDRSVWKRILESTKDDGRIDMTVSSMPTSSGTWTKHKVLWLVDTPPERVQEYLRRLANNVKVLTQPRDSLVTSSLPDMPYTEIKLPNLHPSSTIQHGSIRDLDKVSRTLTGGARRDELLKDPTILSQLHGRQSGKFARTHILHRAIRHAIDHPQSRSVMSTTHGAFTVNLLSEDISAGAWYSIVMTHDRNDDLIAWLGKAENREKRLKDVPFDVRVTNQSRRQRIRLKIRAHVEMLTALGVISPLLLCDEAEADVVVEKPHASHSHFKIVGKSSAPESLRYLILHDFAPVWHVAVADSTILGYMPIRTDDEIERYWNVQRKASLHVDLSKIPGVLGAPPSEARTLSRTTERLEISKDSKTGMQQAARWRNDLRLLPVQRAAMNEAIDWTSGQSRLSNPEEMEAFAWEYAIPIEVVRDEVIGRLERAKAKAADRMEAAAKKEEMQRARQIKAQKALATKLAETQAASKRQWEARVSSACQRVGAYFTPDLLNYVSRQGLTALTRGSLTDDRIDDIIRYFISSRYRGIVQEKQARAHVERVETRPRPPAETVPPLILQTPAPPVQKRRVPRPSTKREKPFRPPGTRYRRKWTSEDDELVVDAEAIIRCRNRDVIGNRGRYAMEQLFPGCLPVTFLARLKKNVCTPERESYLDLLEKTWYEIWTKLRGTPELPDSNPDSNTEFDLRNHIDVLRRKINKNKLRAQAAAMDPGDAHVVVKLPELPTEVDFLISHYQFNQTPKHGIGFEILWQAQNSQEHRLGQVGMLSLVSSNTKGIQGVTTPRDLRRGRLRAILRMIVATSAAQYDQAAAIKLLRDYDQQATVNPEITSMVNEKILVKHFSASLTGRFYSFAQTWLAAAQGPFPPELHQEAKAVETMLAQPEGYEWDLMGKGGDVAALMALVSDNKAEFEFDIQQFPTVAADQGIFNTRKLSDKSFEFDFAAKRTSHDKVQAQLPSLTEIPAPRKWASSPASGDAGVARIVEVVTKSGPNGLSKIELKTGLGFTDDQLERALAGLAAVSPSRVFWAGYDTARLVSSDRWREWLAPALQIVLNESGQVVSGGGADVMCTPRKWVDIWGRRIDESWNQAVECARGWLMSRPGMTERIFREKLEHVMDRLETNDVLQYLLDKGGAEREWVEGDEKPMLAPLEATDVSEEDEIVWRVKPSRLFA